MAMGASSAILRHSGCEAPFIRFALSESTLKRPGGEALFERFARFTGHAPMHYLAKWRMQVAAGLLRQSSTPIASIALEVGYASESAFSRAFRREVGQPPAAWWRQQARRAERQ